MFVQSYRAAKILYNFLKSNPIYGKFLIPDNVCEIIPLTFYLAGVEFQFVDIDKLTLCADMKEVENFLNDSAGLLYVHTYGVDTQPIETFAHLKSLNPDFVIIDDRCLCIPQLHVTLPDAIDVVLYSLGRTKIVNIGGSYGYVSDKWIYQDEYTQYKGNDYELYCQDLTCAMNHQSVLRWKSYCCFTNEKFELNEQLLNTKLQESLEHKRCLNAIYSQELPLAVQLPTQFQNWRFNILVQDNRVILKKIFDNGLFASIHYSSKACACGGTVAGRNTQYLYQHVLNLFNDEFYTQEQAEKTCQIIKDCI